MVHYPTTVWNYILKVTLTSLRSVFFLFFFLAVCVCVCVGGYAYHKQHTHHNLGGNEKGT